jgi:hypothetical protein
LRGQDCWPAQKRISDGTFIYADEEVVKEAVAGRCRSMKAESSGRREEQDGALAGGVREAVVGSVFDAPDS